MKVWVLILSFVLLCSCEKDYSEFVVNVSNWIKNPSGQFYHQAYDRLARFSDRFGPRMWGGEVLELAIDNLKKQAEDVGFDNVRLEPVTNFTKWVRKSESLTLRSPRPNPWPLKVIGLGWSVPCNISSAEVIVVSDWKELDSVSDKVKGKVVAFDEPWQTYGSTVAYRVQGASKAASYGAVGALVRSVTPDSIESVHTGVMHYDPAYPQICVGAIATQDADMFRRMQNRNQTITVDLLLQSETGKANSSNLVFEIQGSTYPEQILLLGGHIDSWDTGSQTGANDDGGGFMTVFQALRFLKECAFIPKRTLRFIAWSGEEFGGVENGAHQYATLHANQLANHIVGFENDLGSTTLNGFGITGSDQGLQLLQNITHDYLSLINITIANDQGEAADTTPLFNAGIPAMANIVNDTIDHKYYFTYHHSAGDSMLIMNPDQMDSNVIGIAALFYILADLDVTIQRQPKI